MLSILKSRTVWLVTIFMMLLAVLYYPSYDWLISNDWAREDYNYCYLIPFVILYLIWEKKRQWFNEPSIPSRGGLLVMLPAILLFWFGELAGEIFSSYISSWLLIVGLLWLHTGWHKIRVMAFPLFVSLFLFPLPHFINTKLTFNLKLISSEIGVKMIQLLGMSAYREGNIIDLGFTQLQVVDACSGLRYLIPLFLMGVLVAYFYRAALWKRLIIAFSAIPLSIITNSLRISLTAILYPSLGPAAAEGFFHDFSGWAIFMISLAVLLAEIWVLRKILPRPGEGFIRMKKAADSNEKVESENLEKHDLVPETKKAGIIFAQPQFIVGVAILVATIALHSFIDFREKPPVSRPVSQFPLVVGEWEGKRQFLDQQFIDVLQFSDYTSIDYAKQGSPPVNIYVAYYESQRKGRMIHSPETCLPGSGWIFNQAGTMTIPLSGKNSSSITVMRAIMEKSGSRQLVYFWFNQRGRILTNAYQMKIYNFWDALVKKRTDGALIRIITPVTSAEKIEDAEKRLQSFMRDIMPLLNEYIPTMPGN
ncbi:MAG: VPLPA-CTERM-specific exosortase XrtD [Smithella sp.]